MRASARAELRISQTVNDSMAFSRIRRHNVPAYAALAMLCLLAVALVRGRFKLGYVLLHVVVTLAERWQDQRALARVSGVLATMTPPSEDADNPRRDRDVRADVPV